MTRRIGFVGNSHIAAVKMGLDLLAGDERLAGFEIDIFGCPGTPLRWCSCEGSLVRPNSPAVSNSFEWTSGGKSVIDLREYSDLFVVEGRSPGSIQNYLPRLGHGLASAELPIYSRNVVRAITDCVLQSASLALTQSMAQSGLTRVHFVGEPYPAQSWFPQLRERFANEPSMAARLEDLKLAIGRAVAEVPCDFSFVPPPEECLDSFGIFTRDEYSRGSRRLQLNGEEHPESDFVHMNASYGRALLLRLFGRLQPRANGADSGAVFPSAACVAERPRALSA